MIRKFANFVPTIRKNPITLSGWIVAAVADAQALVKTRGFKLDMDRYNNILPRGEDLVCHVCLGGAVLVNRGLVAPGDSTGDSTKSQALAYSLDDVRMGRLSSAADLLYKNQLIGWVPTARSLERASELIKNAYRYNPGRAPWHTYLEAAQIVKHKPKQ